MVSRIVIFLNEKFHKYVRVTCYNFNDSTDYILFIISRIGILSVKLVCRRTAKSQGFKSCQQHIKLSYVLCNGGKRALIQSTIQSTTRDNSLIFVSYTKIR